MKIINKTRVKATVSMLTLMAGNALAGDPIPGIDVSIEQVPGGNLIEGVLVFDPTSSSDFKLITNLSHPDEDGIYIFDDIANWTEAVNETSDRNWAEGALVTAATTYYGYSASKVVDGSTATALGGSHSWVNTGYCPSHEPWVEVDMEASRKIGRVEIYTTSGYPISSYRVEYFSASAGAWLQLASISGNTSTHISHAFTPVDTSQVRVVAERGPNNQTGYCRINEIELYNE